MLATASLLQCSFNGPATFFLGGVKRFWSEVLLGQIIFGKHLHFSGLGKDVMAAVIYLFGRNRPGILLEMDDLETNLVEFTLENH